MFIKKIVIKMVFVSVIFIFLSACNDNTTVKPDPVITWENPEDIKAGTPLSEVQLNATADVAGNFIYTPEVGTFLDEGNKQVLTVEFTPLESTSFNNVSSTVSINVIYNGTSDALFNSDLTYGTMTDIDGNSYQTITIGDRIWMAENLRTTKYRNGETIPNVTINSEWVALSSDAYSSYENQEDIDAIATHGLLYNWFAVSDNRNIAPEGWHVATKSEWEAMINNLGGSGIAGGKIKEAGNNHWNSPNSGATNNSGLTALPSGRREYTDGSFINSGFNGFWWTSSAYNPDYSWYFQLNYDTENIIAANFHKQYGFSIRCVKD
jgi:uncharacterized protein (TIGR02145 family)